MVFQFVLHLVLEEDKLETTPVTVEGLVDLKRHDHSSVQCSAGCSVDSAGGRGYLVSQQVMLVAGRVSGHLQAEDTQQEAGVSVEAGEVLQDVRVEGRAIGTHLQVTPELVRTCTEAGQRSQVTGHRSQVRLTWQM